MVDSPVFAGVLPPPQPVREMRAGTPGVVDTAVVNSQTPLILREFVAHWPVVEAGLASADALLSYLLELESGIVAPVAVGSADLGGRMFYSNDFRGLNVERGHAKLSEILRRVKAHGAMQPPPMIYMASADLEVCFPGFGARNQIDFGDAKPLESIWIGTQTRIAAHNDLPLNIACVAAGRRRFTLFPPDQTPNLYVGPFEVTPAGRPVSLVDFTAPDLERFPRFAQAAQVAQTAELGPGDALFIPSMWWHHVEAFSPFNVLVNYWWRRTPAYLGTPQDVLHHAMLTLRDLPENERAVWRDLFEHYVFSGGEGCADHVPEAIRGILAPMTEENARQVRAHLLKRLNR